MTSCPIYKLILIVIICFHVLSGTSFARDAKASLNKESPAQFFCLGCHSALHPGIVKQYLDSPHANPKAAKDKVHCYDCHGTEHSNFTNFNKAIMPSPDICGNCHQQQAKEHKGGKHNLAWIVMKSQISWHTQPRDITEEEYLGCAGCHSIGEKDLILNGHDDTKKSPDEKNGKTTYDNRYGNAQCDACHTRHAFKKSESRDPRTCSSCHMGFDHPQWEMYTSAKHGIIWSIEGHQENGRAPTCQSCHLIDGNHEVRTPWGFFGLRIPTKENVLALIKTKPALKAQLTKFAATLPSGRYTDIDDNPEWTYDRAIIMQAVGILDSDFQPTERYTDIIINAESARGPKQFNKLRNEMKSYCNNCHPSGLINSKMQYSDNIIKTIDHEFAQAIEAVQALYRDGILEKPADWKYAPDLFQYAVSRNKLEEELYLIMLQYRQRAFQGAFHSSSLYTHRYGWTPLKKSVSIIMAEAKRLRAEFKK